MSSGRSGVGGGQRVCAHLEVIEAVLNVPGVRVDGGRHDAGEVRARGSWKESNYRPEEGLPQD